MSYHFLPIHKKNSTRGFTLVETIVAILILSMTVGALLTLAANSFFSVRYAKNQIVANYLMQESLEYVRNDRDNASLASKTWDQWIASFTVNRGGYPVSGAHGCFSSDGCVLDPYLDVSANTHVYEAQSCNGSPCDGDMWFYPDTGFYGYEADSGYDDKLMGATAPIETTYNRIVYMKRDAQNPDQVVVTVTLKWKNGLTAKQLSQSIVLTKWNL